MTDTTPPSAGETRRLSAHGHDKIVTAKYRWASAVVGALMFAGGIGLKYGASTRMIVAGVLFMSGAVVTAIGAAEKADWRQP